MSIQTIKCKMCTDGKIYAIFKKGVVFDCPDCGGTGSIHVDPAWGPAGRAIWEDRMAKEISMRDEIHRLGIDPSLYSRIERGLADPEILKGYPK